jgi:hypothetical protein
MVKKSQLTLVPRLPSTTPHPPRKLGKHGLSLWHRIQNDYAIADAGGVELLMQICCAADRVEQLAAVITEDGPCFMSKAGPKGHPLLREETALRGFIARSLARLGVTLEVVKPVGRPSKFSTWTPDDADE